MNANNSLIRLIAAGAIVAVAVLGLWQAGVLFPEDEATVETPDGTAKIFAASTDVETPVVDGKSVGLDEGDLAPDFEFSTFDGERMRLSDLRGKPIFLNFWASWCGPCRKEMPNMQTMLEKYGAQGLVVLAVNNGESLTRAQSFIDNIEVQLSDYAYDPTAQIVRRYNATAGLPVSFFIDADGVITRAVAGELSFNVMESSVLEVIAGYEAIGQ